jgi:hypothetical protein
MTATIMMWIVVVKTPKIAPGDQAIRFLANQISKKIILPEFTGETSSGTEAEKPTLLPEVAEMAEAPTTIELEEPKILLPETKEMAAAPSTEKMEEARGSTEGSKISEILSPSAEIEVAGIKKGPAVMKVA